MADAEVNALTALTGVNVADGDLLYGEDISANIGVKMTALELAIAMGLRNSRHNSSIVAQSPTANTDTYITGSNVPFTRIKAGAKFKCEMAVTKTAAGTGTPTVNIRVGTATTIADVSRCLFTWPAANTAAADEMKLTVQGTIRSIGSGTSAVIEGMMLAEHELTTTGFGGTGLGSNIIVNTTGGGFDSTVANLVIGISINSSTAGAWTFRQVHTILENII